MPRPVAVVLGVLLLASVRPAGSPQLEASSRQTLLFDAGWKFHGAGVRHPKGENLLDFQVDGPGEIVGVGNANPMSVESYTRPSRKACRGRALVVIKSTGRAGDIRLRVSSPGLPMAATTIRAAY